MGEATILYTRESSKRTRLERIARLMLCLSACLSIAITILVIVSVLTGSIHFFAKVSWMEFLFGTRWSPQMALREDQAGSTGAFGVLPVFLGTLLITIIAMIVAAPAALYAAIYLSQYASARVRAYIKPLLEILAGIPTVVYGYFAVVTVAPALREGGEKLTEWINSLAAQTGIEFLSHVQLQISSESALTAGVVMGIMIIPFILSLSDDALHAVPTVLKDGSLALGATRSETIKKVLLPAAFPGIMSAILLGISRAIGETMIVVMAAGLTANLTANPLNSVTTVTVQIVTLLTGDQEFSSAKTLSAFALGLMLFVVTLILNIVALSIVKRFKEQYQ